MNTVKNGYKYQFGDSPGAINLSETLQKEEYKKYNGLISRILSKFNHFINQVCLSNIEENSKKYLLLLIRKNFFDTLKKEKRYNIPKLLLDYTRCVFVTNYRRAIKLDTKRNDLTRNLIKWKQ